MASPDIRNTNHRFDDVLEEPCTPLIPITGFKDKPLVSLEEATVPLQNLIPNLPAFVYRAKQRAAHPANDLSRDESASIALYTMDWEPYSNSLYYILNSTLRTEDREKLKPWFLYLKLILTALSRLPLLQPKLTVYRGIRDEIPDEDQKYRIGSDVLWWGFSSCSLKQSVSIKEHFVGETNRKTLFIIECLKGKDISKHSCFEREKEILLLPATTFRITSKELKKRTRIIYLKEIESSYIFLEPVSSPKEINDLKNLLNTTQSTSSPSSSSSLPKASPTERERYFNKKLNEYIVGCKSQSETSLVGQRFNENDIEVIVQELIVAKQCRDILLTQNGVTSHGASTIAQSLYGNKTLQNLSIAQNTIDDEGAIAIAQSLSGGNNATLKKLCLSNNNITDAGVEHIARMLETNKTLTHLWLNSNRITDGGLKRLAEVMTNTNKTLQVLALEWNNFRSDSSVDVLINMFQKNSSLKNLSINSCKLSRSATKRLESEAKTKKNFNLKIC